MKPSTLDFIQRQRRTDTTTQQDINEGLVNLFANGMAKGYLAAWPTSSLHEDAQRVLANPAKRELLSAIGRAIVGGEAPQNLKRALTTGDDQLGEAAAVFEPVSADVLNLVVKYSATRALGIEILDAGKTKLSSVKGHADGYWIKLSNQGAQILETASIAGSSITPECSTLGARLKISNECLSDGRFAFEAALLIAMTEGLGYRLDFTAFQGNGTDDVAHGGMTGIFNHPDVPIVMALGHTTINDLVFDDFANAIGGVSISALQNSPRWFISTAFLPALLKLRFNGEPLLTPPTTLADEWRILGFPVTWAAAAPGVDAAGAKVAVFGRGDAYAVAIRQEFELRASPVQHWNEVATSLRALMRARCEMRDAESFAILKLAVA